MALTYGFYNAINHDRQYDAIQVSQLFDGLISDGVYANYEKALIVKASSTAKTVIVQPGRAWFNHTWILNDADEPVTAEDSELVLDRIDALCLYIDSDSRVNGIEWVKGTPASSPVKPAASNFNVSDTYKRHPIAYVYRHADSDTISAADIENAVGTTDCPFVTGIIDTITTNDLLIQWEEQFESWMSGERTSFMNWFNGLRVMLDDNVAANLAAHISDLEDQLKAWVVNKYEKFYFGYQDGKYGFYTDPDKPTGGFHPFRQPHSRTYIPAHEIGQVEDMGEDHEYRYVDTSAVYAKGVNDGATGSTAGGKITYTYHHHTINSTNMDSTDGSAGPYGDNYALVSPAGCFTAQRYVQIGSHTEQRDHRYAYEVQSDSSGNVWLECPYCHATASGGTYDEKPVHNHPDTVTVADMGYRYYRSCGKTECQKIKAVINFI